LEHIATAHPSETPNDGEGRVIELLLRLGLGLKFLMFGDYDVSMSLYGRRPAQNKNYDRFFWVRVRKSQLGLHPLNDPF
jgi:hypothetical protein